MLSAAHRGCHAQSGPPLPEREADPTPPPKPDGLAPYDWVPIWNYEAPQFTGNSVRISNLTCRVSDMGYCTMGVCDSIEWGPVSFSSKSLGQNIDLPLTEDYHIRSHFLSEGIVPGSDQYWRLRADIDQSFEWAFGYEFPASGMSMKPRPLSGESLRPFANNANLSVTDEGSDIACTLRQPIVRLLVVVTLVCCREAYNFDPGQVLGAGRFYPMLMVLSNLNVDSVTGTVNLKRPSRTKMIMEPGASHSHDDEEMTSELGTVLFADRNTNPWFPSPVWDDIFDYYDLHPELGTSYVMVHRREEMPKREIADAPVTWKHLAQPPGSGLARLAIENRSVKKEAGQGEFDNIHVAPKMILRKENVSLGLLGFGDVNRLRGLDDITMAPFCIHDCLHLHTRWGRELKDLATFGWKDEDTPNAEAGAPLVPPNQKITVMLTSPSSYRYTADASPVKSGKWQIMLHHGAAYALSTGVKAGLARITNSGGLSAITGGKWAAFYWNLRWLLWGSDQFERLSWTPEILAKLRESNAQSKTAAAA
jgi:hypothetical protein